MITLEKVQVYLKHNGDIDSWLRDASPNEKTIMDTGDWSEIESIVDELNILKKQNENINPESNQRMYRAMTKEEVENAHKETMRFTKVVPEEYEAVIGELWKIA